MSIILGNMDRVQLLKAKLANIDVKHDQTIMKEETLKGAHTYCVIHGLSAQQYGPLLEKYIIAKFGFKKNTASSCIGDCVKGGVNVEIKASLGGAKHNKFNYVQIRPSHHVEYICTAYSLTEGNVEREGEIYVFRISKEAMKTLIVSHGSYAHGTKKEHGDITLEDLNNPANRKEYALRPTYNDACWKDLLAYRIESVDI